ncbi:hypothetical protein HPB47_018053, partial [Ixodes persulcatus]
GVHLAGDGRCDSPGYSAKYCTYSFYCNALQKIVHTEQVQVATPVTRNALHKVRELIEMGCYKAIEVKRNKIMRQT